MLSAARDYRKMVMTECEPFGAQATFERSGSNHFKTTIVLNGRHRVLISPATGSDHRGLKNSRRDVRKALESLQSGCGSGHGYAHG